jgi:hypothetical protein
LPSFNQMWKYVQNIPYRNPFKQFWRELPEYPKIDHTRPDLPDDLQVYLKIVDIETESGAEYSGVWHLEGMPDEHIIATGIYYFNSPLHPKIIFKRDHFFPHREFLFESIGQCTPQIYHEYFNNSHLPLGELEVTGEQMLIFPNTHIHRVQPHTNTTEGSAHRQFIVFFLVDPCVIVPDFDNTKKEDIVAGFTEDGQPSKELVENMETRMWSKRGINARKINFCEH